MNCAGLPEPVALPIPDPEPMVMLVAMLPDILTMLGFVSLPAHDGTATAERVTITSAAGAEGQPGVMLIVEVATGEEVCLHMKLVP